VDAPTTWVLSNHDVTRPVTRYGRDDSSFSFEAKRDGVPPTDLARGTRRARAAALLAMALPGSLYVYQGEELGLPEVTDLPESVLRDPIWERSGHTRRGRDGCRVPLPWSGDLPPYGFGPAGCELSWLPAPATWAALSVAAQTGDPASTLELYRTALRIRRGHPALAGGRAATAGADGMTWLDAEPGVLAFTRATTAGGAGLVCAVNFSGAPVDIGGYGEPLLSSAPLTKRGGKTLLPVDGAAWFAPPQAG
jgi:alpha-glucosidase